MILYCIVRRKTLFTSNNKYTAINKMRRITLMTRVRVRLRNRDVNGVPSSMMSICVPNTRQ